MSAAHGLDAFFPPGAPAKKDAARAYLQAQRAHGLAAARAHASGQQVNLANAAAMDALVLHLFARAQKESAAHLPRTARLALVATGGYARREMALASDVDLLLLQGDAADAPAQKLAETLQRELWDAGAEVGAALRTANECIALARDDVSARTNLFAPRFLAGDATLFAEFETALRARLLPDAAAFISEQQRLRAARHERFGASLYLLQPNLKEGAGGLRDYHSALWCACALAPKVQSVRELTAENFLSAGEGEEFARALDTLWRFRNVLHGLRGRRDDQLTFELQDALADALGYTGGVELPVEALMRAYYQSARAVQTLSEIVLEECRARSTPGLALKSVRAVEEGFHIRDGALEIPNAAHLRRRPLRMLAAFAVAQQHRVPVSRSARRLLRDELALVDEHFCKSPEARDIFLNILESEHRVTRTLTAMNETGFLARYLPEWAHIVCRWQHVIYHTYTVDVHSIFLVEQLRRLWRGEYDAALPDLAELVKSAPDRAALFLGCLLHDIGKGRGAQYHAREGAELAERCLARLGLAGARAQRIRFIVAAHLLMSHVAQRRDLADPKVIVEFARAVGDRENLRNLYLATFADMRASSETGWTPWRRELLRELYERTSEYLEAGEADPARAAGQIEVQSAQRRADATRELHALGFSELRTRELFDELPRRYFMTHTPQEIARHARLLLVLRAEAPLATALRRMRDGWSELIVCCHDRRGLFGTVTGCLSACGFNIIGANVYTTRAGVALEVCRVTLPPGDARDHEVRAARFNENLRAALAGSFDPGEKLRTQRPPLGARRPIASREPAEVSIRSDVSDFYTVVDVTADDRHGLLYDLTRTLAAHGVGIFISKAATVLDRAADTFYVRGAKGERQLSSETKRALQSALAKAAAGEVATAVTTAPTSDGEHDA